MVATPAPQERHESGQPVAAHVPVKKRGSRRR